MILQSPSSRASEARPGTHTPCPIERVRRMGPRLRGDDKKLNHGRRVTDTLAVPSASAITRSVVESNSMPVRRN
jgi:hypothetical protein